MSFDDVSKEEERGKERREGDTHQIRLQPEMYDLGSYKCREQG